MKRIISILFLFALLLQANAQTTTPVNNIKLLQVATNSAKFNIPTKSNDIAIILSKNLDSTKTISINTQNILSNNTIELKNLPKQNNSNWIICTGSNLPKQEIILAGLEKKTDYYLNIYTKTKSQYTLAKILPFNTVDDIPLKQASQISIADVTENTITIKWVNGTGTGRIIAMRKGAEPNLPENGKAYKYSNAYGASESKLGESYVVYDGNDKNTNLTITNLEPGKYFLQVFEYNGDGKFRAYNVEKASNNPRSKATLLPTPKILSIENISEISCEIKWEKVKGANTYILDVATDPGFLNKLELYNEIDVGNLTSYEIVDLAPGINYYIRIKAVGEGTESKFSDKYQYKPNK